MNASLTCHYGSISLPRRAAAAIVGMLATALVFLAPLAAEAQRPARPIIASGAEIDYPPFSIVAEDGRATGFAVELMRSALGAMEHEVTFRTGPWPEVRGWLERGEIDALPLVGRTPEREAIFDFTVPYMSLYGAIVVRKGTTGIRDVGDLKDRQVAVMKGDNAEEFLRREDRGISIVTTDTFETALRELSMGQHDAVVLQRLVALRLLQDAELINLEVINRPIEGFRQEFCFAVREGDRETLALLNEGLAIVMTDGTYRHLYAKWFAALQLPTDRRIVIGGDHNFPPFEFLDENGRPAGFNVDLTRAIARELGLQIDIRLGTWIDIKQGLENGSIDAVQGMFYSSERDLVLDFSQSHMVSHYVGVVRRNEGPPPESLEALTGRRLVVQQGDIAQDFLSKNAKGIRLALVEAQEDALRAVVEGRSDVALVARQSALYWVEKNGWGNLVVGRVPLFASEYGYAVGRGHKALLAELGEGLEILDKSGEYRRIHEKWMGVYEDEGGITVAGALRKLALVLIAFLAVFAVVVLWSWSLRRQVARKTRALQESYDTFRSVFEAANVGKSLTLPTGEVNANQAFADLLGYTREELWGKTWQDLTPAEDIEATQRQIDPLLKGDQDSVRFEKRYIRKDGRIIWVDLHSTIHRDSEGRSVHFVTNVVDITDRKKAEANLAQSEERFRRAVEEAPFPIMIHAEGGEVLTVSRTWLDITGYRRADIPTLAQWTSLAYGDDRHAVLAQIEKTYTYKGRQAEGAFGITCKDGSQRIWSFSSTPLGLLPDGRRIVISMAADVTENKQAEERLRHLTRVLRALRRINQIINQLEDQGQLLQQICKTLTGMRGYTSAWVGLWDAKGGIKAMAGSGIGEAFADLHADLARGKLPACCRRTQVDDGMVTMLRKKEDCEACPLNHINEGTAALVTRLRHGDHDFGMIVVSLPEALGDDMEEQVLFKEIAADLAFALQNIEIIQAREQMAVDLAARENQYRLLADNTLDAIWTMNMDLEFTYVNPAITQITGYTPEEWIGSHLNDHCDEARLLEMAEIIQEEIAKGHDQKGVVFETVMRRRDGSEIHVEIHGKVIFDEAASRPVGIQGTTRDISERKQAETALVRSEHHLRTLVDSIPDLVWLKDLNGVYLSCNKVFERFFGAREADIIGKTDYDFMERDLADFFREHDQKALQAGGPCMNEEYLIFADGSYQGDFETIKTPMYDSEGNLIGVLGIARDVSAHKEAERALRENEQRYKSAQQMGAVGNWEYDMRTEAFWGSDEARRMYGFDLLTDNFTVEEVESCILERERVHQALVDLIEQEKPYDIEFEIQPADGSPPRIIRSIARLDRDASGDPFKVMGVVQDITRQKENEKEKLELENQLHQAQKLESVGRLAGGVAHDFNNILSVIIGYAELAIDDMSPQTPLYADIEEIIEAGKRSRNITRQLLAFARKETVAPEVLDLNETVANLLKMLKRLIGEDIDLAWRPAADLWPVRMDPSQVDQILANLCVNARDAIANVGKVTIETGNAILDEAYCADHADFKPGDFVMIVVSDDGSGMDRETIANVFEPFFTTKGVGRGTGLGLATVYGIVKQNDGFINVYSEPGEGASFRVYLPRYVGAATAARPSNPEVVAVGRGETVLVVEDDPAILKLINRILEPLNYKVIKAHTPAEAISLAETHGGGIHLLLTDVVMPGMNGRELSDHLTAMYPKLRTLFMSGYTANVIAHRGVLDSDVHFIHKPFSKQGLAASVRSVLDDQHPLPWPGREADYMP